MVTTSCRFLVTALDDERPTTFERSEGSEVEAVASASRHRQYANDQTSLVLGVYIIFIQQVIGEEVRDQLSSRGRVAPSLIYPWSRCSWYTKVALSSIVQQPFVVVYYRCHSIAVYGSGS